MATTILPAAVLAIITLLQFQAIDSTPVTYHVGDEEGWDLSIDMQSWTRGKNFHAGDFLVFEFDDQRFDVALVNEEGFDTCTVNAGAKVLDSGSEKVQLAFGANYFIDSVSDICAGGLKMAINATAPPPLF
ncbi:putative Early nodulin-like protein 22 [Hibiscus syriacus]|uniref:Early nodulin-like protein 22 n=1 Tax=Hibiscus syriacus TaxID=106335 RepID=A0A6A3C0G8_HIBSY|nr:basic blue protein-like [Hibiscus syriacus]KAE8721767.1 putative Early nodulin-like protein 22 [Hibiscus syriacus]